jgi:DNA-binding response OmpR family regulator
MAVLRAAGMEVQLITTTKGPVVADPVDVVVADLRPTDVRSGAVLRLAFELGRPVIVITTASQVDARLAALRYGAADHVVAPTEARELVERVRHVAARVRVGGSGVPGSELTVDRVGRTVRNGARTANLTPSEMEVLGSLVDRAGEVVTKAEIAAAMTNRPRPNTVEVHMSALRRKLESVGAPVVKTVHGRGYVLRTTERRRPPTAGASDVVAQRQKRADERAAFIRRRDEIARGAHLRHADPPPETLRASSPDDGDRPSAGASVRDPRRSGGGSSRKGRP